METLQLIDTRGLIVDVLISEVLDKLIKADTKTALGVTKPPLGLKPKGLYEEHCKLERVYDIVKAMKRYSDADSSIPQEWVGELYEIMPSLCGA